MALRVQGKILRWPTAETTGVASLASLSLNRTVLHDTISVLGPYMFEPKPPCVDWLREEAGLAYIYGLNASRSSSFTSS